MSFSAELPAKALAACLRGVSAAADRGGRSNIPIFSHALLKVSGGRLTACATNLDHWLSGEVECAGTGETTVSASRLEDIAAALDGSGTIKAKANGSGILEVSQGRANFKLPTLPVEEFPAMPVGPERHRFTFPSVEFAAKLRALEPAICNEASRFYLAGIYLDLTAGKLVATNGHILGAISMAGLAVPDADPETHFILPRYSLAVIYSLCKASEEITMTLHAGGLAAQFVAGSTTYRTKLIDGKYPDYQRVIPRPGAKNGGRIHCSDLLRTIDCVLANTEEFSGERLLAVTLGRELVTISSHDHDGREARDVCDWNMQAGSEITVGFSGRELRWAASSLGESATLRLEIEDAASTLLVTDAADNDGSAARVVVPRRL